MSETGDVVAHPLTVGVDAARAALAGALAAVDFSASEDDLRGGVRAATALLAQAQALVMAVVAEADQRGVCERDAHTAVSWLRELALVRAAEARAVVRRSVEVNGPCPRVGAALRRGDLSHAHADVVTAVLRRLPVRVDALTRARAEEFLVDQARVLDPTDLGGVGRELFERVAGAFPDVDDPADARAVEREAERAAASAYERRALDLYDRPHGEVAVSGSLSGDAAATLRTFLDTVSTPTRSEDGVVDERTATQRRADALTELVTATLDAGTLPEQGGNRPQVTVTVALETLQRMAAAAAGPRVPRQASLLAPVGTGELGRLDTGAA